MIPQISQEYWDSGYKNLTLEYRPERIMFKDLFERTLIAGGECFEVGCYPGDYLVYLGQHFGYTVSGVDTTPYVLDRLPNFLAQNGVRVGILVQEDFLHFTPDQTYDLVCSFGFIEHFENYEAVLQKHIELVRPGGILVISCPNFTGAQYLFHFLFDRANLRRHVMKAMNLKGWHQILRSEGMEILESGHVDTVDFWVDQPNQTRLARAIVRRLVWLARKVNRRFNWPNPFFSPFMICISRKKMNG
jgi:SAM-dependent methyltransferase